MQLVIHPAIEVARLEQVRAVSGALTVQNAETPEVAQTFIADADAFFGKITPALLNAAPHLQWIQAPTASLEHYIFPELVEHPCTLTNMRGLFSDVIADHVLGYVICFARNFHRYLRQQWECRWEALGGEAARSTFSSGPGTVSAMDRAHRHLPDCTVGVVGVGAIGSEVLRRATAFGMRVLGVDPHPRAVPGVDVEVWDLGRLPQLLNESDFVVVAAPHTPDTEQLFLAPLFKQMRPSAIFINIGRGAIVNLADLTLALQTGTIAGAGLDVFECEPLPAEHPLWKLENVIITPHVAAASPRIAERHTAVLLENVGRFVRGEPLLNVVDKRRWF